MSALSKQGMKSVLLDLRGNPGGLLPQAIDVVGRFEQFGIDAMLEGSARVRMVGNAAPRVNGSIRVASGSYDMAFADINALIRYRDQHPSAPVKAVFMVYNKPAFSIVSRKVQTTRALLRERRDGCLTVSRGTITR